ncbi:T9SS type A sorting domain-containing protein [Aequorivita sediminis]
MNGREVIVADLQSGVYFIEFVDDQNNSAVKKIIKE